MTVGEKLHFLDKKGFKYSYKHGLYVNVKSRTAFSEQAVEEKGKRWIVAQMKKSAETPDLWDLFFKDGISDDVKRQLRGYLEGFRKNELACRK